MGRGYYMIRSVHADERDFEIFLESSVVAVGWSDIPFAEYHSDMRALRALITQKYYAGKNISPTIQGKKLNEAVRLCGIRRGDYILVPYHQQVLLAVALGELLYSERDREHDLANQQKVAYQRAAEGWKTVPKGRLSEPLQRRLRVRGATVSDLGEFRGEIEMLFGEDSPSARREEQGGDDALVEAFKADLLQNIDGAAGSHPGGMALERLVRELLTCEGYTAELCGERRFPRGGDADIIASRIDPFSEQKVLVQVNHRGGVSEESELQQLLEVFQETDTYDDYAPVFITTAALSEATQELGALRGVTLMDGPELADWIFTHLDSLSEDAWARLGISSAPSLR